MDHRKKIQEILESYPQLSREYLTPVLQKIQDETGYLSEDAIIEVSKFLKIPASKVFSLATFYNQFRFSPPGKYHIQVCHGTSCHVDGTEKIVKELKKILKISSGESTRDGQFSLEVLPCLGACAHAPVMVINGEYYTRLHIKDVSEILSSLKDKEEI